MPVVTKNVGELFGIVSLSCFEDFSRLFQDSYFNEEVNSIMRGEAFDLELIFVIETLKN